MDYREFLAREEKLVYTGRGSSMKPLIRPAKDLIVVERLRRPPKKYDVLLFQRDCGDYVLHRLLQIRKDGYVLCGDNQWFRECGIREDQVIGVLTAVIRGGREIRMDSPGARLYAHLWCDGFWLRAAALRARGLIGKIRRRLRKKEERQAASRTEEDRRTTASRTEEDRRAAASQLEENRKPAASRTDENRRAALDAAYLAGRAAKGEIPDQERIAGMDLALVRREAGKHLLAAAAGMALESAGISDPEFRKAVAEAQRKLLLLDLDRKRVAAELEKAGIWYMPLKGSVLKDLYPRFGMREMTDVDILFDQSRAGEVRDIMQRLGFKVEAFDVGPDDQYSRPPVSFVEMHRELFGWNRKADLKSWAREVRERLIPDADGGFGRHFTPEDFYLYLVAHEYKHFSESGGGLRSLLDVFVYLRKTPVDLEAVRREAEKLGLADFERENRELAFALFREEPLTEAQQRLLDRFLRDGAFGSQEDPVRTQVAEMGRGRYFLSRLTLPKERMLEVFPLLRKAPVLYPVFWVGRLARGVLFRRKRLQLQMKGVLGMLPENGDPEKDARKDAARDAEKKSE